MAYLENTVGIFHACCISWLGKNRFKRQFFFKTETGESSIYNIRIDNGMYPIAAVVKWCCICKAEITMSKENPEYSGEVWSNWLPPASLCRSLRLTLTTKWRLFLTKRELWTAFKKQLPSGQHHQWNPSGIGKAKRRTKRICASRNEQV